MTDFEELKQLANDISKGRKSLVDLYEYGYYRPTLGTSQHQETSTPIYSVAMQGGGGND